MDQEIKVSVIIPVYNAGEYLRPCLDSVIGQTLQEIEILCVDDGSTDGSGDVLEEYAEKDSRLKVFHQQNQYAGCARNLGLKNAVGKYVVFWDADDLFRPQALEKLYHQCEEDQAEICVCSAYRVGSIPDQFYKSGVYVVKDMLPEIRPFSKKDIPGYIFNFTTNVPWNKMFLREFIVKNGLEFQAIRQANDVWFSMMALFLSERITVVPEALMTYRMDNKASLTGKASDARYCTMDAFRAVHRKLEEFPEFEEKVRQSFANRSWNSLIYSLRTQWDIQTYAELFEIYKTQLLPEFEISGHDTAYIYDEKKREELHWMEQWDYQQFLLFDFRSQEQNSREKAGSMAALRREDLELKKEIKHLKKIEASAAYRAERKIAGFRRRVKRILSGGK